MKNGNQKKKTFYLNKQELGRDKIRLYLPLVNYWNLKDRKQRELFQKINLKKKEEEEDYQFVIVNKYQSMKIMSFLKIYI